MLNEVHVKSVLNKTKRRDAWFLDDYTVNPYSACSFNCLYCYVRGSKYGINMAEKISVKINAIDVLEKQLKSRANKKQYGFVVFSSATDPYLQLEKDLLLSRRILELFLKYRFPVHIITKSDLVLRDLEIICEINKTAILPEDLKPQIGAGALITFSFSTLDERIAHIFEPGAPAPSRRLQALAAFKKAGLRAGVSLMPLLPYITDTGANLEQMYSVFSKVGPDYVMAASVSLFGNSPSDSKNLVLRAVSKHFPELEGKYGRIFSKNSSVPSHYHAALLKKTNELCAKYNLKSRII